MKPCPQCKSLNVIVDPHKGLVCKDCGYTWARESLGERPNILTSKPPF